jgi:hypothetical protein
MRKLMALWPLAVALVLLPLSQAHAWPTAAAVGYTADVDAYVSTAGTDGPTCGPSGTPCRTIQYAIDLMRTTALFANRSVRIRPAAGTYAECVTIGSFDSGTLDLRGDLTSVSTWDDVSIECASGNAIQTRGVTPNVIVRGVRLTASARDLSHGSIGNLNFCQIIFDDANKLMGPENRAALMWTCGPSRIVGDGETAFDCDAGMMMVLDPITFEKVGGGVLTFRETILTRHMCLYRLGDASDFVVQAGTTVTTTGRRVRNMQNSAFVGDGTPGYAVVPGSDTGEGAKVEVGAGSSYENVGQGIYP